MRTFACCRTSLQNAVWTTILLPVQVSLTVTTPGLCAVQAVMEKLRLGVAASATATCDCSHETLVEHMEVKLTKVTGGAQWDKALAPITLTSNFSAMNAEANIQSALMNGMERAAQHADVIMVNMGLWWMCACSHRLCPLHACLVQPSSTIGKVSAAVALRCTATTGVSSVASAPAWTSLPAVRSCAHAGST